ncbi:hypothetical protein J2W32_006511 [Variovorax boronicumulans]|uniref:DUF945 domain-containing protein n=1 Tax=Variovorax boronicumulans TaxID=436515 RepID=A0AAW8DDJ0_9BURK|nr:DUF932 domain-containing protein [Variovorax boronicumulans]MDP9897425.1 hypothetical protein [Variovorax boronicumulans]MDQ0057434.1 hypothetical protein [Variovorax boronicumulans]
MLASRFGRQSHSFRSASPISDEQLRRIAPSIYAEAPHASRSERYTYIPTSTVLGGLRKEGFEPFMVCQTRVRDEGKREFTKHMLRLRHPSQVADKEAAEIVLLNSHDGTSSYQMLAGMFRFVCSNGLVCGDTVADVRVRHKGHIVDNVIEGAYEVLSGFEQVRDQRDAMRAIELKPEEARVFASAALELKYDASAAKPAPITETQILAPRRHEDARTDLWSTFNVAQENLVRGGLIGRNATGQRRRTREVQGIDQGVKLNRALWMLAEGMRKLKA